MVNKIVQFSLVALLCAGCATRNTAVEPQPITNTTPEPEFVNVPDPHFTPGTKIKFKGVIVENRNNLPADGNAVLYVSIKGDKVVTITYDYSGESNVRCDNTQTAKNAASLKAKTAVDIYAKTTSSNSFTTCDSPELYITPEQY